MQTAGLISDMTEIELLLLLLATASWNCGGHVKALVGWV